MIDIISLGAGVQSSTMALMAAHGEFDMPTCAIFADTQAEPNNVYTHLDWLEKQLPYPVYPVTAGSLKYEILAATQGKQRMDARPPFFVSTGGMLRRQCTQDYKLTPIQKKVRELLGMAPRQRKFKERARLWIGISLDEISRMKLSRVSYIENVWPLVEKRMTRSDCIAWVTKKGYAIPPKSSCTFCPYHDNQTWRVMKMNHPESFSESVLIDEAIRNGVKDRKNGKSLSTTKWFVHRSLKPLKEIDFRSAEELGQLNLFENECEGMCGV